MNFNFMSVSIKTCLVIIIFASCESHEQRSNDAFDRFKEEKMTAKDCVLITPDEPKEIIKAVPLKLNESPDEWTKFKNETEKKIVLNENKIKKIKQTPEANIKLFKKIVHLEKENDDLKIQLKKYEEEVKINLEKFKEKIQGEVSDLDIKLKDIVESERR